MPSAFWGTLPQWISAAAAAIGAAVAIIAATAWRKTMRGKRGDDLLAGIYDFAGAVGSTKSGIDRKVSKPTYGNLVDRLYTSFLQTEKYFVIAQRSYGALDETLISQLRPVLEGATNAPTPLYDAQGAPIDDALTAASARFTNLQRETEKLRQHIRAQIKN